MAWLDPLKKKEYAQKYRDKNKEKFQRYSFIHNEKLKKLKTEDPIAYEKKAVKQRISNGKSYRKRMKNLKGDALIKRRELWRKKNVENYKNNRDKILKDCIKRTAKNRAELSIGYVNHLLSMRKVHKEDRTPELIEAFKLQLRVKRELEITN